MSQPTSKLGVSSASSKARDPPPSLFLHPSPAASHVSLPGMVGASAAAPSSVTAPIPPNMASTVPIPPGALPMSSNTDTPFSPRSRNSIALPPPRLKTADSTRTTDRTDALWAEMQATLEEVELSASQGTRVFGAEHEKKLADLRAAQIALAQAWARSEADDAIETTAAGGSEEIQDIKGVLGSVSLAAASAGAAPAASAKVAMDGTDQGKSTVGTGSARPPSSRRGAERLGASLEEETEVDILLARKRREANDQYFSRVDQGVRDVVAKLEEVAVAMRAVERESRDVWGDESVPDSFKT